MIIDFDAPLYAAAKRRGYINELAISAPSEWEMTFVGQYIIKYANKLKDLQYLAEACGYKDKYAHVEWKDFTERNLKKFRDIILSRMCANSARTCFAKIKSILNDMKNEVVIPCLRFADILKSKKEPSQHVYLTEVELDRLEALQVSNAKEQYVRSICLISAYTGARHSDAVRMGFGNFDNHSRTITYVSQKTHVEATIPIHRNLSAHVENISRMKLVVNDIEFNDIIRDLCKRAGINENTKLYCQGKEQIRPKYEFVASHTFRRTFATLLYQRGCDVPSIGRMMGHSGDLEVTMGYIVGYKELSNQAMSFFG